VSLADAFRALARDGRPLEWDAWYPLAQATASDPQFLVEAVGALDEEDQYALLDHLKADGGPLADYLVVTLAANPAVFGDDQVRLFVLADSSEALSRRQAQLAQLVQSTRAGIDQLQERRAAGFDLAREIVVLEQRRNELRAAQIESGQQEMSELEWDIARLEILQSRLVGYNPDARRARRDELRDETERLRAERESVEDDVAKALRLRDEAQSRCNELETRHKSAVNEHTDLQSRHADLASQVDDLTREVAELEAANTQASEHYAALEEQLKRLQMSLRAEESRLAELQSSPVAEEAELLRDKIRELYRRLPSDDADQMFTPSRRGPRR